MLIVALTQALECFNEFEKFRKKYKKVYNANKISEMRDNFCLNWMYLNYLIAQGKCENCGITAIMDRQMSYQVNPKLDEEDKWNVKQKYPHTFDCQHKLCAIEINFYDDMPFYNTFDLRDAGTMTDVKDQGNKCASCWAYSLSAVLESLILRDQLYGLRKDKPFWTFNHKNLSISEQFIMSNSKGFQQYCDKGNFVTAVDEIATQFDTIELTHNVPNNIGKHYQDWLEGIPLEPKLSKSNYYIPFEVYNYGENKIAAIRLYDQYKPLKANSREMNKIKAFISRGIAVSGLIYAAPQLIFYQKDDIVDIKCPGRKYLNHQITFVGYGKKTNRVGRQVDVWVIRNSWSREWGSDGLFFVTQGKNSLCSEMYFYSLMPKYQDSFQQPIETTKHHSGSTFLDYEERYLTNHSYISQQQQNDENPKLWPVLVKVAVGMCLLLLTIIMLWQRRGAKQCMNPCDPEQFQ